MLCNPGGYIPPADVVGRDELIKELWRILERQSVVLTAQRRIGKTCLINKMTAENNSDILMFSHDVEGLLEPLEFVELIFNDVENYLSLSQRTAVRARKWLTHLTGLEIGGIIKFPAAAREHWKILLIKTVEDLVENQSRRIIFFWDELPLMLYKFAKTGSEDLAMEVLDVLRSLRQMNPSLRMVFTGSIGLHNVLMSLKKKGYANDPTNDMYVKDVPALSHADATALVLRLMEGEKIKVDEPNAIAKKIAREVNGIPFYIHSLVDRLRENEFVTLTTVRNVLQVCLTEPMDSWHMKYFLDRLKTYYVDGECATAMLILDILSSNRSAALTFDEILERLKSHTAVPYDPLEVIASLQRDHYIVRRRDGRYCFRFTLLQRWWRLARK